MNSVTTRFTPKVLASAPILVNSFRVSRNWERDPKVEATLGLKFANAFGVIDCVFLLLTACFVLNTTNKRWAGFRSETITSHNAGPRGLLAQSAGSAPHSRGRTNRRCA
jgi:hypothetical protein